ncbi:MAG: hypothetical protein WKF96_11990 [Solirubrobacteraceae bacterium]
MADPNLVRRVHRNLMEVSSWFGEDEGGDALWHEDELFFAAPTPLPFLNGAMRDHANTDADGFIGRAREYFAARDRGFVVFGHPGDPAVERAAVAAGLLEVMHRYPAMVCPAPITVLPGDIRLVEDQGAAAAYWRICDEAYPSIGMPPGLFTDFFAPADLLPSERSAACLGYRDGEPVACASVYVAVGVGMVGWVGALPAARGLGLAAACTVWATNRAFAMGADVASLQASEMGEPIYRRLGYEELFSYRLLGPVPD